MLLVQTIMKLFGGLSVCLGIKLNNWYRVEMFCFVAEVMLRLSRSLRVSATQDTDKPEIQPVSEPESLHSCVFSCVRVWQA